MHFKTKIFKKYKVESHPKRAILNRSYDVPYLAGYNTEGTVVYLDKDFPEVIKIGSKDLRVSEFIEIHELTEKQLEDRMGYSYPEAHKLATKAEEAKVKEHGIDPKDYEKALKPFVKAAREKKNPKLPPDLDIGPYKGDEKYESWFKN